MRPGPGAVMLLESAGSRLERETTMKNRIILDNACGITLQLGSYACSYSGRPESLAADVACWLRDGSTDGWEGHDEDARAVSPSVEELRNGGYRLVPLLPSDRIVDIVERLDDHRGWLNAQSASEAFSRL